MPRPSKERRGSHDIQVMRRPSLIYTSGQTKVDNSNVQCMYRGSSLPLSWILY